MADKRKQIIEAAEKMFTTGRYHEVTLDDICHKARIGKGTVYRYFQDKEDLFWQVILSGHDELVAGVEQVATDETDPGRGLRRVAQAMADFFTEHEALFGLMWSDQLRTSARKRDVHRQWHASEDKIAAVAAKFIAKGMHNGLYATMLSPVAAAHLMLGMVHVGLHHRQTMPGGKDWVAAVVELFERGLLVRAGKTGRQKRT